MNTYRTYLMNGIRNNANLNAPARVSLMRGLHYTLRSSRKLRNAADNMAYDPVAVAQERRALDHQCEQAWIEYAARVGGLWN